MVFHPVAPRGARIDALDEMASCRRGAVDATSLDNVGANMDDLHGFPLPGNLWLVDDAGVPEASMVRADVANEGKRSDPAHERIGQQAVSLGDGGTIIGMRHFEQPGKRPEVPSLHRHPNGYG